MIIKIKGLPGKVSLKQKKNILTQFSYFIITLEDGGRLCNIFILSQAIFFYASPSESLIFISYWSNKVRYHLVVFIISLLYYFFKIIFNLL